MNQGAATTYRLGVDVGGTFTDLLLIDESSGDTFSAKVPSTPADSSIGVLNGIAKICEQNGIAPERITHVMHGTTVATNTVLEGKGARVGLVTTAGYRHVLQIARSYVPGGLGGWVIYNKRALMAPLELTIEADERLGARGEVVKPLDEAALARSLTALKAKEIEARVTEIKAEVKKHGQDYAKMLADLMLTEEELRAQIAADVRWEKYATGRRRMWLKKLLEVIESDPRDLGYDFSSWTAGLLAQVLQEQIFRHRENLVDALLRPVCVAQLLHGKQHHAAAHRLRRGDDGGGAGPGGQPGQRLAAGPRRA